jgi:hypothetical protein
MSAVALGIAIDPDISRLVLFVKALDIPQGAT